MKRVAALAWALLLCAAARAGEPVELCFNYGCVARATVALPEAGLAAVGALFAVPVDAAAERDAIALAVGHLYRLAGESAPIAADRAGNYLDQGVDGRMDCIDHSTTTTRLLTLIEARGWLRFHRVLAPARRTRFILFQHFSAAIEELPPAPAAAGAAGPRFAVDSWFVDHGEPAVILPLPDWLNGEGPNVH